MSTIKVLDGDFKKGNESQWMDFNNNFYLKNSEKIFREKIPLIAIEKIDVVSEEEVKRLGSEINSVEKGLLTRLITIGKGKDITFVCQFKDHRKFIGVISSKEYYQIQARLLDLKNGKLKKKGILAIYIRFLAFIFSIIILMFIFLIIYIIIS